MASKGVELFLYNKMPLVEDPVIHDLACLAHCPPSSSMPAVIPLILDNAYMISGSQRESALESALMH
eukprot:1138859-Pelagomonas_calceolata.AAC.9